MKPVKLAKPDTFARQELAGLHIGSPPMQRMNLLRYGVIEGAGVGEEVGVQTPGGALTPTARGPEGIKGDVIRLCEHVTEMNRRALQQVFDVSGGSGAAIPDHDHFGARSHHASSTVHPQQKMHTHWNQASFPPPISTSTHPLSSAVSSATWPERHATRMHIVDSDFRVGRKGDKSGPKKAFHGAVLASSRSMTVRSENASNIICLLYIATSCARA